MDENCQTSMVVATLKAALYELEFETADRPLVIQNMARCINFIELMRATT